MTTDAISLRCRVNEADLVTTEELRYRRGIVNAISTIHAGVIRKISSLEMSYVLVTC